MEAATLEILPVVYSVTDAAIAEMKQELTGLTADTPANYEKVRLGIAQCRGYRVDIEERRKELKAPALEYGKKIDDEAKRVTALLVAIEDPLQIEKDKADAEKARIKKEKEDAIKAKMEAEIKAKREAEEAEAARIKAENDEAERVERARIAEEQRIESERLATERARLEAEQAIVDEQNRAMQVKLDEEAAALKAEREQIERERFERETKLKAEREATEKVEREAAEKKAREDAAKAEAERLAAMAPDREKLAGFALVLRSLKPPMVNSLEAQQAMEEAFEYIADAAGALELFAKSGEKVAA